MREKWRRDRRREQEARTKKKRERKEFRVPEKLI